MSEHHCAIYFSDPAYTLDDARNALDELGLEIVREGECLKLSGKDLPSFVVRLLDDAATVPAQAQRILARLRTACGHRAVRVDHIGSTAVAGMAAKDVIDVQVTVDGLGSADEIAAKTTASYEVAL